MNTLKTFNKLLYNKSSDSKDLLQVQIHLNLVFALAAIALTLLSLCLLKLI